MTIVRASTEELVAKVQGTSQYEVSAQWQGDALTYACNCPAPDPCKHTVAAVLAWEGALGVATERSVETCAVKTHAYKIPHALKATTTFAGLYSAAHELELTDELAMPLLDALAGAPSSPEVTALRAVCKRQHHVTVGNVLYQPSLRRALKTSGVPERAFVAVLRGVFEAAMAELPEVPATGAALQAWAVENQAERLLDLTPAQLASTLDVRLHDILYYGGYRAETLREFLTKKSAILPKARARVLREVAQAARLLHVDRARSLERIASLTPSALPPLDQVFSDLRALHQRMCDELLVQTAKGVGEVRVQNDPLGFGVSFLNGQQSWRESLATVTVSLERWRQGAEVKSSCGTPCGHSLRALEACLDWLSDGAQASAHEQLATELLRPSWARVLAVLEIVPEASAPAIVSWRVGLLHDALRIEPYVHQPKASGGYSRGSGRRVDSLLQLPHLEPVDRLVAELLRYPQYTSNGVGITWQALLALVRHPRIFRDDLPGQSLTIERGVLELAGREDEAGGMLLETSIEGHVLGSDELDLILTQATRENGRAVWLSPAPGPRCRLLELSQSTLRLLAALRRYGPEFPRESHTALLETLSKRGRDVAVVLPEAIRGEELTADETPTVRARLEPDGALVLACFVRPLGDDIELPSGEGPQELARVLDGKRQWVHRDLARERKRAEAVLRDAGAEPEHATARVTALDHALDVVSRFEATSDLRFEWAHEPLRRTRLATIGDLKLRVTERRDWFGLEGALTVEGHKLEVATLLEHVRQGRRWVKAGQNAFVELSAALRQRLEELEGLTTASRNGLELSIASAPVLEDFREELASFVAPPRWKGLIDRFRASHAAEPPLPEGFAAELRDYQREGFTWLARLSGWSPGAVLA
ncbi:MAG: hypothetical protein H7Z43_14325, partial [Clostridia bacterium]|nr:hypothetical protein [Deltaproteobacteria bacterium]